MATCMKTFGVYLCTQLKRWLRKNKMLAGVLWELRLSYIGASKRWWLWHDVPWSIHLSIRLSVDWLASPLALEYSFSFWSFSCRFLALYTPAALLCLTGTTQLRCVVSHTSTLPAMTSRVFPGWEIHLWGTTLHTRVVAASLVTFNSFWGRPDHLRFVRILKVLKIVNVFVLVWQV